MASPDDATIFALRRDLALQLTRALRARGLTQAAAAEKWDVPQPTVSKIVQGQVDKLSIELLVRIAVRANLPLTLLTGIVPEEAGVHLSLRDQRPHREIQSRLAKQARDSLQESHRRLTPTQRLRAFLEHSQLVAALHLAGREAEQARLTKKGPSN